MQLNPEDIFRGIINKDEYVDLSICNPPFHASAKEAQAGTLRKLSNLNRKKVTKTTLNFGGKNKELWCEGGEEKFVLKVDTPDEEVIQKMIFQSQEFASSCLWFTTLVAKQAHLKAIYKTLKTVKAVEVKTIPMSQGNKTSRIVAWTFLNPKEQQEWIKTKW